MVPGKQKDTEERADLIALYQVTTQDLAFFKSQQWSLTNYGLLALTAIAGTPQITGLTVTKCIAVILCISAVVIAGLTAWLLWRLHGSIEQRRDRLERVYAKLSDAFRDARGVKSSASAWEMVIPLWAVLLLALALSLWLVVSGV
jgi:hypothetical protein